MQLFTIIKAFDGGHIGNCSSMQFMYCILSTLVMLPWWWSQKWSKHVGN